MSLQTVKKLTTELIRQIKQNEGTVLQKLQHVLNIATDPKMRRVVCFKVVQQLTRQGALSGQLLDVAREALIYAYQLDSHDTEVARLHYQLLRANAQNSPLISLFLLNFEQQDQDGAILTVLVHCMQLQLVGDGCDEAQENASLSLVNLVDALPGTPTKQTVRQNTQTDQYARLWLEGNDQIVNLLLRSTIDDKQVSKYADVVWRSLLQLTRRLHQSGFGGSLAASAIEYALMSQLDEQKMQHLLSLSTQFACKQLCTRLCELLASTQDLQNKQCQLIAVLIVYRCAPFVKCDIVSHVGKNLTAAEAQFGIGLIRFGMSNDTASQLAVLYQMESLDLMCKNESFVPLVWKLAAPILSKSSEFDKTVVVKFINAVLNAVADNYEQAKNVIGCRLLLTQYCQSPAELDAECALLQDLESCGMLVRCADTLYNHAVTRYKHEDMAMAAAYLRQSVTLLQEQSRIISHTDVIIKRMELLMSMAIDVFMKTLAGLLVDTQYKLMSKYVQQYPFQQSTSASNDLKLMELELRCHILMQTVDHVSQFEDSWQQMRARILTVNQHSDLAHMRRELHEFEDESIEYWQYCALLQLKLQIQTGNNVLNDVYVSCRHVVTLLKKQHWRKEFTLVTLYNLLQQFELEGDLRGMVKCVALINDIDRSHFGYEAHLHLLLGDVDSCLGALKSASKSEIVHCFIVRSLLDISVGNVESSDKYFDRARTAFGAIELSDKHIKQRLTAFAYFYRCWTSALAGVLGGAIAEAKVAYTLIKKLVARESTSKVQLIQLFYDCHVLLAEMLICHGSFAEAEHYLRRGVELSQGTNNGFNEWRMQFRLNHLRKLKGANANEFVTGQFSNPFEQSLSRHFIGDLRLHDQQFDKAREQYQYAAESVSDIFLSQRTLRTLQQYRHCVETKQLWSTLRSGEHIKYHSHSWSDYPITPYRITQQLYEQRVRNLNLSFPLTGMLVGSTDTQLDTELLMLANISAGPEDFASICFVTLRQGISQGGGNAAQLAKVLDKSNGLTLRRELLSVLHQKLSPEVNSHEWPSTINEATEQDNIQNELYRLHAKDNLMNLDNIYALQLPSQWLVLTVSFDVEHETLWYSRMVADEKAQLLWRPLSSLLFTDAKTRFNALLTESDDLARDGGSYTTATDKRRWWTKREEVNERLRLLLSELQELIFGGYVGLLNFHDANKVESCKQLLQKIVNDVVAGAQQVSDELARMCLYLKPDGDELLYQDIVGLIKCSVAPNMTKSMQHKLSLKLRSLADTPYDAPTRPSHTVLILDKNMTCLPFECMSELIGRSVTRAPSMSCLHDLLVRQQHTPNNPCQKISYVLNPAGDLLNTEKRFKDHLSKLDGVVGKTPSADFMTNALQSDVYMYFGHGNGERYCKNVDVRKLDKCAVAFLFGCSSGKLNENGAFELSGAIMDYLIAGSLSIVCNLWDVTDRELDTQSLAVLESTGLLPNNSGNTVNVAEAVASSRNKCRLEYLTGAAMVVYGLPLKF